MISYYMQCAITTITGPVLIIIDLSLDLLDASYETRALVAAFKRIYSTVAATNAFFAFSLVAASVARLRQDAFLFEIMFMKKLNQLQVAIVILSTAYGYIQGRDQFKKQGIKVSSCALGVVIVVLWIVFFSNAGHVPYSTLKIYHKIIAGCVERWGYEKLGLDATKPQKPPKPESALKSFVEFVEGIGFMLAFLIGIPIVMGLLTLITIFFNWLVSTIGKTIDRIKRSDSPFAKPLQWTGYGILWLITAIIYPFVLLHQAVHYAWKHYSKEISLAILGAILLSPAVPVFILYSFQLTTLRRYMHTADSKAWGDDQWGFGQITAVLLWGPVVMQLMDVLLMHSVRKEAAEYYEVEKKPVQQRPAARPAAASQRQPAASAQGAIVTPPAATEETNTAQPPPYSANIPTSPVVDPASPSSPTSAPSSTVTTTAPDHLAPPPPATANGDTATSTSLSANHPPSSEIDLALAGNLRKRTTFDSTFEEDGERDGDDDDEDGQRRGELEEYRN